MRFAGCNLRCAVKDTESGFNCDTDFTSGREYSLEALVRAIVEMNADRLPFAVIFTGGEPALQLGQELVDALKAKGAYLAVETNGTHELPFDLDWVCVSPKSAEHTIVVRNRRTRDSDGTVRLFPVDEVKYVRQTTQALPKTRIKAVNYLISPAFEADGTVTRENLEYCINLVKENPQWQLSVQQHKFWRAR